MVVLSDTTIPIERELDIVSARQKGRELAATMGFSGTDQTLLATAISEVARNIVSYAGRGTIVLSSIEHQGRRGLMIVAEDHGPGIANIELAMRDGFSTGGSLGAGLPGAKRLVDDFELASTVGAGTTVTLKKWLR
jgi:serine/threonine-protein kinase RsbT